MDSFLRQRTTSEVSESTHLSLIGGKYNIPYYDFDMFYDLYVKELNKNKPMFLVERVRYPCYLFIDLDNIDELIINDVYDTVNIQLSTRNAELSKTGVHIIYKNIIVNNYEEAVVEASKLFAEGLDTSVYKSGLRMLGSSKNRNVSRVYKPFNKQEDLLNVEDMYNNSLLIHNKSLKLPCQKAKITKQLAYSSDTNTSGLDFSRIHPRYKNVNITNVFKRRSDIILQTMERFCTNVQREHKSNHIYFVVTKDKKMYQRCYCTCDNTQCKNFNGELKPVPIKMYYTLQNHL